MVDPSPTLVVEIPVPSGVRIDGPSDEFARHLRLLWLVDLVRTRAMGPYRAAREAGLPLLEFYKVLQAHRVPTMDIEPEELDAELEMLSELLSAS